MTTTTIAQILLNDGTLVDAIDIDTAGSQITITYLELILTVTASTNFSVGTSITGDSDNGNDGVGEVIAKDGNDLTVRLISGTFVSGNGVDNVSPYSADDTTITAVAQNVKVHRTSFNINEIIGTYYNTGE